MNKSFQRNILLATVFTTGMAVLIVEVLAIRLLSPQFGTSMFVLSSVLTVVLSALALGYFFGGRLADRYPHPLPLYSILVLGGFSIALSYTLAKFLLPFSPELFSITTGPLFFSLLLFFIPAFLLGTDSPYVIALLTRASDPPLSGAVTGTTFFWSTVGSIVGSLSSGFFFIPFVGIENTLLGTAILLALGGTTAGWLLRNHAPSVSFPIRPIHLLLICVVTIVLSGLTINAAVPSRESSDETTLYEGDGYYGHIRIFEKPFSLTRPPALFLRREVNSESALFKDSYDHIFEYTRFADLYPTLRPHSSTTSFLLLGGGAYSLARNLAAKNPDLRTDVVELEPLLFPLAIKYFDLHPLDRITNHTSDARVFVQSTSTRYDFIFMDTFSSGLYIPAHLTTVEFFQALRNRLSPDGLLMVNFIGAKGLPGRTLTDSFAKTIQTVFPNIIVFTTNPGLTGKLQNIVFIARADDTEIDLSGATISTTAANDVPLSKLITPLIARDPSLQTVFTDDRSAADYLVAAQIAATK